MYLCNCHGVTEQTVIDTVNGTADAFIFAAICTTLKNKGSCCKCLPRTKEVIDEAIKQKALNKQAEFTVSGYSGTPTS